MAWYQPGRTLAQASRDCEECRYEVMKFSSPFAASAKPITAEGRFLGPESEFFTQCMKLRGYVLTDVSARVKAGQLKVRHGEGLRLSDTVAGE
jgi:hypothetical protein